MSSQAKLQILAEAQAEFVSGGSQPLPNPSDLYPKLGPFYTKLTNYGIAQQIPLIGQFQPNPSEAYPGGTNYGQYKKDL
jgi:hypothetical protein